MVNEVVETKPPWLASIRQVRVDSAVRQHVVGMPFTSFFHSISDTPFVVTKAVILDKAAVQHTLLVEGFHRTNRIPFAHTASILSELFTGENIFIALLTTYIHGFPKQHRMTVNTFLKLRIAYEQRRKISPRSRI